MIAAVAALLVFASGSAAAEMWTGETSTLSFQRGTLTPELTLVRASASYEPTEGNLRLDAVTSGAPQLELEGKLNMSRLGATFLRVAGACNLGTVEAIQNNPLLFGSSLALLEGRLGEPTVGKGITGSPAVEIPVQKVVSGTTTTFTTSATALVNQGSTASLPASKALKWA
ncbi:MAG: hypothetical protein JST08_06915 [Actinobacteria bacterium]|nr:hypothetical protein [Actinomycetota bacterium]